MGNIDLSMYGIKDVKEIIHNPSYELLYEHEMDSNIEGYEKRSVTRI